MRSSTSITGIYVALEDFTEKAPDAIPPVYNFPAPPDDSPLRRFIALQQDALLVLGPRRIPPVMSPTSNTHTAISTCTSVGFRMLENEDYVAAVQKLRPDVALALADVVYGAQPGAKRPAR
ncbi:trna-guanine transglycosylase family protein [Lasallia pustulata]|uniref:Trna-guanine transglycosylase family protein n=1 Tax=Lasallia pustulata TaxID=136370 RepID=A0A1W5DEM6_9LECA|nr:trna-guanine transglycosylase family protein [Lasallia pustulata]